MLCIFQGKQSTDSQRLRTPLEMTTLIEDQLTDLEHSPTVRHNKNGLNRVTEESVYVDNEGKNLTADEKAYIDSQDASLKSVLGIKEGKYPTADVLDLGVTRPVHISPSLDGITMDVFDEDYSFGNGCTVNATKIISDVTSILLTYVVFPEGTTLTSDQLSTLKTICETMVSI